MSSPSAHVEHLHVFERAVTLLSSSADFDQTLEHAIAACLPALGDFGYCDVKVDGGVRRTVRAHQDDGVEALLRPTGWVARSANGLNVCALTTGEPALHTDVDDAWYRRAALDPRDLDWMRRLAFRSMVTVPMRYRSELIGALTLFMARSGRRHGSEALDLAASVAALAAPVVANARLADRHQRAEQALREREQRLNEALAAEREARAAAEQARRRLELLAMAGTVFSGSLEPQATLQEIAALIVPDIADWCRVDLLDAGGVLRRALTHHSDPQKTREAVALVQKLRGSPDTPGTMAWTVESGLSHLARFDQPNAFDEVRDRDLLTFARAIDMRAFFVVPLIARGRTLGALGVVQAESGRQFSQDDCALVAEIAQRAAVALDNARLFVEADGARRDAEHASRAKDEFLAMLGHELRNPLAPIVTALHLMSLRPRGDNDAERRIIGRQVAHLSRLVDDLLDVSRITRGKVELRHELLDLAVVVDKALELAQPLLGKRVRPIEVDLPAAPVYVEGDAVRLAQVVSNLLTNAAKYTPDAGRVALRVGADNGAAEIVVEDEGRGIAPDLLPRIFDLFVQGEQSMARQTGGLGLGLTIVKTLVQMHGGMVSASSDGVGRGACFTVRLPRAAEGQAPAPAQCAAPRAPRGRGRVLVVDDNVDAAETLAVLLETEGYDVRTASDAAGALALLDAFPPGIAILDIGLPAMDGYELARCLRADARVPGMRLVALTGYGRDPDRQRAADSGFDEHLVKPVSAETLLEVLARWLPAQES
jgi:signal transduction histidine kinase/ActR/RegA family two-component response regulator